MVYIGGMAKKFTISLGDEEAEKFSLELFKSQLLQDLLKAHYRRHQPNDSLAQYVTQTKIDPRFIIKDGDRVVPITRPVMKTKQDAEKVMKYLTPSQKADQEEVAERNRRMGL